MSNTSINESVSAEIESFETRHILKPLLTIFGIIFSEFLIMGISLGVIPAYVHGTLGFSNLIVGLIIGIGSQKLGCIYSFISGVY